MEIVSKSEAAAAYARWEQISELGKSEKICEDTVSLITPEPNKKEKGSFSKILKKVASIFLQIR